MYIFIFYEIIFIMIETRGMSLPSGFLHKKHEKKSKVEYGLKSRIIQIQVVFFFMVKKQMTKFFFFFFLHNQKIKV